MLPPNLLSDLPDDFDPDFIKLFQLADSLADQAAEQVIRTAFRQDKLTELGQVLINPQNDGGTPDNEAILLQMLQRACLTLQEEQTRQSADMATLAKAVRGVMDVNQVILSKMKVLYKNQPNEPKE